MIPQQAPQGQPGPQAQPGQQMPQGMQQPSQQPQGGQMAVPDVAIEHFTEILHTAGDPMIQQLAQNPKYMTNPMYGPLINAELTRRVAARQQQQMQQQGQGPQPTVVEQAQQQAQQLSPQPQQAQPQPQQMQLPEDQGIAQLPVGDVVQKASGGIVALAEGGLDDDYVEYDPQPEISYSEDDDILVGGTEGEPKFKSLGPEELAKAVGAAAKKYNVNPEVMWRIMGSESNFTTGAKNPHTGYGGYGGVIKKTWEQYGGDKDPRDPYANIDVTARIIRDNQARLRRELGREPTAGETYGAHFLGPAAAPHIAKGARDEPFDTTMSKIDAYKDPEWRKNFLYKQNPNLAELKDKNRSFGDFMTLVDTAMSRPVPLPTSFESGEFKPGEWEAFRAGKLKGGAARAAPADAKPGTDDLYFGKRVPMPESLKGTEIPSDVSGIDKLLTRVEGDIESASTDLRKFTLRQRKQNPDAYEETRARLARAQQEKDYLMGPYQDALKREQPKVFGNAPTDFKYIPKETVQIPNMPVQQLTSKEKAKPDVESELSGTVMPEYVDYVAPPDRKKIDPRVASADPAMLLEAAKQTIPAKDRRGMSDEALLTFFLQLMGGRSRNALRNVSGAGLAALAEDRAIRKEETERRKEENLAKYYEAIAESYKRDPEQIRIAEALRKDPKLMATYQQMLGSKNPYALANIRDKVVDNVDRRIEKDMFLQAKVRNDPSLRAKMIRDEMAELLKDLPSGGGGSSVIDWNSIGKQ